MSFGDWVKRGIEDVATGGLAEGARALGINSIGDLTGANAAKEQQDAALAASKQAQDFIQQQARLGNTYIDQGTGQAGRALKTGLQGSQGALGEGYGNAINALGGAPNRLADLYNGGLASGFQTDPGYQFRLQQGEQAINRSAAAQGGRLGGATLKALSDYGQGMASNEFNNYANRQIGMAQGADQTDWQRQSGLAGLYQNYGTGLAGLDTGNASQLAQLYSGAGSQKANNAIGVGGAGAQLMMAPVQYAGGASQANANFGQNLLKLGLGAVAGG